MLSSPFLTHAILKLTPVLSQKSEQMQIWWALSVALLQKRVRWPHFLFHDFKKDSASFQWGKKTAQIYVQFFGNFTKLYGLSYNGSNSTCLN